MAFRRLVILLMFITVAKVANSQTSFAPLVEELMPTVVNISTDVKTSVDAPDVLDNLIFDEVNRETLGSGFIVDDKGHIATNLHVIENADKISVITSNGSVYNATIIGQDSQTDIALIKIDAKEKLSAVVFGDSDATKVGDWVLAIGNPFGLGSSVTAGIVSAKARDISDGPYNTYIQTDASINQGNSGGPMFNINGEVVGINTAMFSNSGNSVGVGFALPSNELKWILKELAEKQKVERSWLGIELKKATTKDGVSGLVITSFADVDAAKNNKLEIGDMILEYNSKKAESLKSFSYDVSRMPVGSKIELVLWRNKELIKQDVQVWPMTNKKNELDKNSSKVIGTYYQELGVYLNNNEITGFDNNSEMASKGALTGDKIIKINNKDVLENVDIKNLIENAQMDDMPVKIELTDNENKKYFIELQLDRKG